MSTIKNRLHNLKDKPEEGFTLIELLVVLLIIGILLAGRDPDVPDGHQSGQLDDGPGQPANGPHGCQRLLDPGEPELLGHRLGFGHDRLEHLRD